MSDIPAVVFHNSYATVTEKLRITKMTTRLPAAIFAKAPIWKSSFARHDGSHAKNTASVVSVYFVFYTRTQFAVPAARRPSEARGRH